MSDTEDIDVNLLSELLEMAEKDDVNPVSSSKAPPPEKGPAQEQSFDSFLEDLDKIPVSTSSKGKLSDKTGQFNNQDPPKKAVKGKGNRGCSLHSGDTDSSDDEEARKHGSTVDNFGASVKRMLKTAEEEKRTAPRLTEGKSLFSQMPSWKSPAAAVAKGSRTLSLPDKKNKTGPMDAYTDSSIGIRIINPLVSSSVIKERLVGRKVISMSQVKQFTSDGKITDDWVIFGVIISKAPPRTSAKGSNYSIIKLSDLRGPGNPRIVSLFLFSSAFKNHGKDSVGTVLGILNPGVMDNSRNHGDEACLSVDNSDRVMILGTSKDFGLCKSKKKNGENCTSVVNTALCEYCVYHVKQEYQKCSRRSELQSTFNGPGLANLRNKVLGKNEVFYGGQSFSAIPAKKSKKLMDRDQNRLSVLSGRSSGPSLLGMKSHAKTGIASSVELSHRQSQKDVDRLRKLILDDGKALSKPTSSSIVTAKYNPDEVKPDDAKSAALALIAKKTSSNAPSVAEPDNNPSSSSSVMKDAAVMTESVPQSRGVMATLALNKKRQSTGDFKASSLGLGRSASSDEATSRRKETDSAAVIPPKKEKETSSAAVIPSKKEKETNSAAIVPPKKEDKCKTGESATSESNIKPNPKSCSKLTSNKRSNNKPTTAPLSSDQLLKIASNGVDLESRMLKQAAQKAALEEEAAKLCPNATPSMLGLGRSSAPVRPKVDLTSFTDSSPKLGRGLSSFSSIDLDAPISKKISQAAKLNAINLIKRKGGISKEDPNFREFGSRKKVAKEAELAKRPRDEKTSPTTNLLKKFKADFQELDKDKEAEARKARFKELMEATSRHADLVDAAEDEAQEKYFGKLEKKEQMEEKMLNTFRVECKAVRCSTCKYTAFSASELCKTERHPLKVIDATKRFFKCGDCGNRTVCLTLIPVVTCSNCSGSRWEKAAMIRERKVGLTQEVLSVRGMEETYIGTVTTGANVNLLVPDEGT
ncbi:protein MCM10 homolog [Thrips palmi]|uniref:Protein MCM10 homolog n=1 Tax=Thrips palmi TaxID=161013 RepID=A0A6P8ZA00_THRPL|nr:protein MCM10 homolog [Thrips palmi]